MRDFEWGAVAADGKQSEPVSDPEQFTPDPAVMALAEASGDPGAFHLVYSTLMQRYDSSCRVGHMTQFADEAAAIAVQVLRAAGRLQPAPVETRTEWGVRYGDWMAGERYTEAGARRMAAETEGEPMWRAVGAWLPAPTPEPVCSCPDRDVSTLADRARGEMPTVKGYDPSCPIHGKGR